MVRARILKNAYSGSQVFGVSIGGAHFGFAADLWVSCSPALGERGVSGIRQTWLVAYFLLVYVRLGSWVIP